MFSKSFFATASFSLLALIACNGEAGVTIDPPALATDDTPSSSSVSETENSIPIYSYTELEYIKNETVVIEVSVTYTTSDKVGQSVEQSSASSGGAVEEPDSIPISVPTNNFVIKNSTAIAYCINDSASYQVKINYKFNTFAEKTLTLKEYGSACNDIFEQFKTACTANFETVNDAQTCDDHGNIEAKCTYFDESGDFDTILDKLSEEVSSNCNDESFIKRIEE